MLKEHKRFNLERDNAQHKKSKGQVVKVKSIPPPLNILLYQMHIIININWSL